MSLRSIALSFVIVFQVGTVAAQPTDLRDFTHRQRLALFHALLFGFDDLPKDLVVNRFPKPNSVMIDLKVTDGKGVFHIGEPAPGIPFSALAFRDLSRREDIATALGHSLIHDAKGKPYAPGLEDLLAVIRSAEMAKVTPEKLRAAAGYGLQQSFINLYAMKGERSALRLLAWLLGRNNQVREFQFGDQQRTRSGALLSPTFDLSNENLVADYLLVMTFFALDVSDLVDAHPSSEYGPALAASRLRAARILTLRLRGSVALRENPELGAVAPALRRCLDQFNALVSNFRDRDVFDPSPAREDLFEAARQIRATLADSEYYKANFLWPSEGCGANLTADEPRPRQKI